MFKLRQWVNWQPVQVPGEKKPRKIPSNPSNTPYWDVSQKKVVGSFDQLKPDQWLSYQEAQKRSAGYTSFIFTPDDPYFVIDIDHCKLRNGQWSQDAKDVMDLFPGAYMEVSYSGDGLHILARGKVPPGFKKHNKKLGLEVYDQAKSMCITGTNATGDPNIDHQAALNLFCSRYIEPTLGTNNDANWSTVPRDDWSGPVDDDTLINKMHASKPSADSLWSGKASLLDLWTGNESAFLRTWPDNNDGYDRSSADAALFSHLNWWCGCDHERVERIARRSGLVRDKWDRVDYLRGSILAAASVCKTVYNDKRVKVAPPTSVGIPTDPTTAPGHKMRDPGPKLLSHDQQIDYFRGCVYVREAHQIMIPDGSMLTEKQFKVSYGGFEFGLDDINHKSTDDAFKCFTQSRAVDFAKVSGVIFRPELDSGKILTIEGRTVVNSYYPVDIDICEGDVTRFLVHLSYLFPNPRDRDIILAYMAAVVQHIGTKMQWCPLVQGAEGNGKSVFMRCISYAVGKRMSHFADPNDLGNKFNGWLAGKLFVGVEEIRVSDRRDAIDALKIMITNNEMQLQAKGGNQYLGDVRANFFMCSNHKDAVNKTINDRRYAVFYTPQQSLEDINAWGMDCDYFYDLYKWLNNGGYAAVAHFLQTYDIPDELNPATRCNRAPETTSTSSAIKVSLGTVEQEIENAIGEGLLGFRNHWVSSIALHKLLIDTGKARFVSRNKRSDLLETLGYENLGRSSRVITQEGGQPILYLKKGIEIYDNPASDYITAQGFYDAQEEKRGPLEIQGTR